MRKSSILLPLLFATPAIAQELTPPEAALKAHVAFLASDAMRGRDTGSPELAIAEQYVAAQMLAAGLAPGAPNGAWLQPVPLVSFKGADHGTLTLARGATATPLEWGKDFVARSNAREAKLALSAPVVFAGYGVTDRATGHDDYKGLDVKGKIVAILRDAPHALQSEVRAHLGQPEEQAKNAAEHGAIGVILIEGTTRHAIFPFEASIGYWNSSAMTWADPDGRAHLEGPSAPAFAYLSMAGAEKLFAGAKLKWSEILAADKAGKKLPTGPLGVTAQGTANTEIKTLGANNVVGLLEGSNPALKNEYVVISAHLDHVGVGKPDARGDTIYNGAMDNAVGTAAMLEVARAFVASGKRPRRSILFVAVTAEEKGLVGSDYFAANPTVPKGSIVADVNLDMPVLTYRFEDLVVYGADRTSIGPTVAAVARAEGLALTPDPAPEQASFVRSDHYSFVRAGIPAVSLEPGPAGPGKAAIDAFGEKHYHQPSDEIGLIDFGQGVRFVKLNYAIARALADADQRPLWNKGDFFGTLYGGPGAK
ncbi:M28 family metallopeptidase [Sphingomonas sp. DG1-23]|uniref:M28 family metallopeptidase n=1 Tax=Sphingomonas sp. DG1-23 TaxID=3068316 RepID=UPI00273F2B51|nr:M28 family metallopeptidase [Sphingomonas sp. DG1-23]MDP5280963.1 M28 family metallopeptidase [Sphingomonas sp. DG1-23]